MGKEFLLEIGTEEIPSRFINPALDKMKELFAALLSSGRVTFRGDMRAFGTPRRLVLYVPDVDERQADISKEVAGPPRKVAYDAEGKPTKAALVFAEKNGVPVGYVLASGLFGSSEVMYNVFETFRGGESAVSYLLSLVEMRQLGRQTDERIREPPQLAADVRIA